MAEQLGVRQSAWPWRVPPVLQPQVRVPRLMQEAPYEAHAIGTRLTRVITSKSCLSLTTAWFMRVLLAFEFCLCLAIRWVVHVTDIGCTSIPRSPRFMVPFRGGTTTKVMAMETSGLSPGLAHQSFWGIALGAKLRAQKARRPIPRYTSDGAVHGGTQPRCCIVVKTVINVDA